MRTIVKGRGRAATGTPTIDVERIAAGLRTPGIDPRTWLSAGTVGFEGADGVFHTSGELAANAFFVDTLGARVSVRLEPEDEIVTARVGWLVGRAGRLLFPVRPGDEVVVAIPGGDFKSPACCVVGMLSNATASIPEDWNNDRVLFDLNVPFEVRAPAIKLESPALFVNGRKVNFGPEGL